MIDREFRGPEQGKHSSKTITLAKETELRVRTDFDPNIWIKLDQGTAEIFGAELTPYFWYRFPRQIGLMIFTWGSCVIRLCYQKDKEPQYFQHTYSQDQDNPNYYLANLFVHLDSLRKHALVEVQTGPRVLVVGGAGTGKNTVCRTLVNYTAKLGWDVLYSDLDHATSDLSPFSTISVRTISNYLPYDHNEMDKLSYFYDGSEPEWFVNVVKAVGEIVDKKLSGEKDEYYKTNTVYKEGGGEDTTLTLKNKKSVFAAGIIFNSPAWLEKADSIIIKQTLEALSPTIIICIEESPLLKVAQNFKNATIIKLPKNDGVVTMGESALRKIKDFSLDGYFFDDRYICTKDSLPVSQPTIVKMSKGQTESVDPSSENLNKHILAISNLQVKTFQGLEESARSEALQKSPLLSLLYVFDVKQEEMVVIRPPHIGNSFHEYVWVLGQVEYFHG